mmetsp:Transcript_69086/g.131805  ORF Transcript_69086/g.131805 Transcript_69086/m.131805 type:complete len:536 (+) Transcript_69086:41-1648(+)
MDAPPEKKARHGTCTHCGPGQETSVTAESAHAAMRRAIDLSRSAVSKGNRPFGAVLVDEKGNIVLEAENRVASSGGDVTAHAETELVRKMCASIPGPKRATCTLYTSTEPCVMCAGSIFWSGVGKVVYACSASAMADIAGKGGWDIPNFLSESPRKIAIEGPFLQEEALAVHRSYWGGAAGPRRDDAFNKKNADVGSEPDSLTEVSIEKSLLSSGMGSAQAGKGQAPIIDLSQPLDRCISDMWKAATEVGFFTVINHGIPSSAIDEAFDVSRQFFDLPRDTKEAASPFLKTANAGYEFMSQVRPSTGTPDQKESIQITARSGVMDDRWPRQPATFEKTSKGLLQHSHALASRILSMLEKKACPDLKSGTLAASHHLWSGDGQCTLRMLHYPPVQDLREVPPGYWRAGAHTDWCCVTLLFQLPGNEGLECAANPRVAGQDGVSWMKVDPVPGGIAVNVGDMLGRWSDGRLLSNLHRVRMPTPEECDPPRSRYSIAFFMQADKSALIECAEHPPITAGDYILGRIKSNFPEAKAKAA